MFAAVKNKIREETGNDLSKLTAKITSTTVQKIESLRGRSQQGSTSSLNSIISSEGYREDGVTGAETLEDLRKRLLKIESEFSRKLEQKEQEWREILKEKDKRLQGLEREKDEAYKQISNLKEALKNAEESKLKVLERQENNEQLESFQSQELTKVKKLVLQRDQELAEKNTALKDATNQLEKLRVEVARLRRQEELLSDVQDDLESLRHSTSRDMAHLATELAKCQQEKNHLFDLVTVLRQSIASEATPDERIVSERKLLEQRLEEAHLHLADIKTSWSDKIASLETQVGRLSRQAAEEGSERRRAVAEKDQLAEKVKQLEAELECSKLELTNKDNKIQRLTEDINDLSVSLKSLQSDSEEEIAFLRTELVSRQ